MIKLGKSVLFFLSMYTSYAQGAEISAHIIPISTQGFSHGELRKLLGYLARYTDIIYTPFQVTITNNATTGKIVRHKDIVSLEDSLQADHAIAFMNLCMRPLCCQELGKTIICGLFCTVGTCITAWKFAKGSLGSLTLSNGALLLYTGLTSWATVNCMLNTIKLKKLHKKGYIAFQEIINRILPDSINIGAGQQMTFLILVKTGIGDVYADTHCCAIPCPFPQKIITDQSTSKKRIKIVVRKSA